ncbi:LacI family DNA-binding transcriptional regulator [Leucobacter celer]|uniref:LacI family DNA-binding transcriptional regulator n=1 Tax=Leucobacter celer TaxID=668625 RepID=UPI0006A7AF8B|nr:LacI family DNA-binding transcriptional regulator [Leucobacter celer]
MSAHRPVTLKALAQELGLNPSTVSRVLKDPAGGWASPETATRIVALADRLGYRRNPHAASLRTARSNLVGVIVPRLQDFVLATIYEGIDEAADELGYLTMVSNSLDDADARRTKTERLLEQRVDGLIFGDARFDQRELFDELADRGFPHLLVSRRLPGHISVTCDDRAGGRLMAEHLLASGRRSFGVIAGKQGTSTSLDRTEGFVQALRDHGIAPDAIRVAHGGFDTGAGRDTAEKLLEDSAPEAVFATNDFAAIGALGALQARGLRVPDDVALCGYNDTPLGAGVNLTSIRSPMHEMGRRGFQLLFQLLGGASPESEQLAPELIIRASTSG